MPDLEHLMNEYRTVPLSASGEAPRKLEIISRLENELEVPAVLDFMLTVLRDATDYDLARIEICRALASAGRDRLNPGVVGAEGALGWRIRQILARWGGDHARSNFDRI